jgi:glyoxylase-like metal-dependent hydrolase (beta-lactamase superfamily II)
LLFNQQKKRDSNNGQINWSQSSQPYAKATDQERAAATEQAEKERPRGGVTPDKVILLRFKDPSGNQIVLKEQGVKIVFGPGHHPTSGANAA